MKIELNLPVTISDKELTNILNSLNKLGVPHNLISNQWYDRTIELDLDHNFCQLVTGIMIGQLTVKNRKK